MVLHILKNVLNTYFSDIIIGETTCDGKKKMYELLNEIKETYVLHLPQSQERLMRKISGMKK